MSKSLILYWMCCRNYRELRGEVTEANKFLHVRTKAVSGPWYLMMPYLKRQHIKRNIHIKLKKILGMMSRMLLQ